MFRLGHKQSSTSKVHSRTVLERAIERPMPQNAGINVISWPARIIAHIIIAALILSGLAPSTSVRAADFGDFKKCFSGGCDLVAHINRRFDAGLQSKARSIAEPLREIFLSTMNELFETKITPMLNDVDALLKAHLDRADEIATAAIDNISTLVDESFNRAQILLEQGIANVRDQIIAETFRKADELRQQIVADVNGLLDKVQMITHQVDCATLGNTASIRVYVDNFLGFLPQPFNSCVPKHLKFVASNKYTYLEMYRIHKCDVLNQHGLDTTVQQIMDDYASIITKAAEFRCIERLSMPSQLQYTDEIIELTRRFFVWRTAVGG